MADDVAADATGAPVAVYTTLHGVRDTFRYARWDGEHWRANVVADAGRTLFTYHNAGITLDHADPRRVVLSRTVTGQNEIELRKTADHGATWATTPLTAHSPSFNIRPVVPRGLPASAPLVVLHVAGRARSFREYDTTVRMTVVDDRSEDRNMVWACRWTAARCSAVVASRSPSGGAAWAWCTARSRWSWAWTSPSR